MGNRESMLTYNKQTAGIVKGECMLCQYSREHLGKSTSSAGEVHYTYGCIVSRVRFDLKSPIS